MSKCEMANEQVGLGKTEDSSDEYFINFNKALPDSKLVTQEFNNILTKEKICNKHH